MNSISWITLFMPVFTFSFGQKIFLTPFESLYVPVESCISYSASESPMLNIKWNTESIDIQSNVFTVLYRTTESNVLTGDNCIEGNNRINISIEGGIDYVTEVRTTLRGFCDLNVATQNGSSTAEYGYISNLERISSEDNSTINFTCHLACQTDFITGCSITLVDACGKNFIQFCAVENSQTFSPRQCSVSFQDLPPSRYEFLAKVRSNSQLQLEENILNMTGTFITADDDNFSCEPDDNGNVTNTNSNTATNSSDDGTDKNTINMSSKTGPLETPTASTANNGDDNVTNNDTLNTTSSNDEETSKRPMDSKEDSTGVVIGTIVGGIIAIVLILLLLLMIVWCYCNKYKKKRKPGNTSIGINTIIVVNGTKQVTATSDELKVQTNPANQVLTSDQAMKGLDPAYKDVSSDQVIREHDPAYQKVSSDQVVKGLDPAYQKVTSDQFIRGPNQACQNVSSDQVMRGYDPAYQKVSSDQVVKRPDPAYQKVTSDQIMKGPDPAYQKVTFDQIMKGPDPAYQKVTSDQVTKELDPAYQEVTSDQVLKGPNPVYQEI